MERNESKKILSIKCDMLSEDDSNVVKINAMRNAFAKTIFNLFCSVKEATYN